jgi:hypothetical protein
VFDSFGSGLILPVLLLAMAGWAVPRLLARVFAEGVGPLIALGIVAALIVQMLAAGVFMLLYLWQGVPLSVLFEPGVAAGVLHFARLGFASALIWGPILVLSVAGLPRHWRHETW